MSDHWRLCSICKTPIAFSAIYQVCSVSTCNRKRTGLTFCSVYCWEAHLPSMRHREAWAVEKKAPTAAEWEAQKAAEAEEAATAATSTAAASADTASPAAVAARRRVVANAPPAALSSDDDVPREVLIVASKLKKYVKARSGMNTSDRVIEILSDIVRRKCDAAIRRAGEDGRRTILDRDFE